MALPTVERRLALEAAAALIIANLLLRLLSFRLIARIMCRHDVLVAVSEATQASIAAVVRRALIRASCVVPWRATCLVQALAGRLMLGRRGVPCTVHFGVRRQDGFAAHAWLTAAGAPVSGMAEAADFTPIAAFSNHR